jgi:hypothetical protein
MQHAEALQFIDEEMRTRWPHWQPTSMQITDWAGWLRPFRWESARNALRRYASEAKYGREPEPGRLLAVLRTFGAEPVDESETPDPAEIKKTWLLYMGGGPGRLQPGWFTEAHETPEARAKQKERLSILYTNGGEWHIVEGMTERQMIQGRNDIRGIKPPAEGEDWKTYAKRIGYIEPPKSRNAQVKELLASERKESA